MNFSSKIVWIFLLLLMLGSCKKEVLLESPQIEIKSIEKKTGSSFLINVDVNLGKGQRIKNARLILEDITILSSPVLEKLLDLTKEKKQNQSIIVETNKVGHDYAISAAIETDQFIYSTEKRIIRSPRYEITLRILESDLYTLIDDNILYFLNPGQQFRIEVQHTNLFPYQPLDVKLNGSISTTNDLNYKNEAYGGNNVITVAGNVMVPDGTPPGDYEVSFAIDGIRYVANKKIRVLSGKFIEYENQYPGEIHVDYSHFILGDKLYVVGGNYYSTVLIHSPVWEYDLTGKIWNPKKDFPYQSSPADCAIMPFELKYNNEGYIVVKDNDKVQLWKYNPTNDSWAKITQYPGSGKLNLTGFVINNKLYMGGGRSVTWDYCIDFWSYDLISNQWERRRDYTVSKYFMSDSFTSYMGEGYIFTDLHKLVEYNPENDQWSVKADFPGPLRTGTSLVPFQNNLFLIGGIPLEGGYMYIGFNDCFQYSPATNAWSMKAFLPCHSNHGFSFIYNNNLYYGLGYKFTDVKSSTRSFYQFIP